MIDVFIGITCKDAAVIDAIWAYGDDELGFNIRKFSKEETAKTLDPQKDKRSITFDSNMVPYDAFRGIIAMFPNAEINMTFDTDDFWGNVYALGDGTARYIDNDYYDKNGRRISRDDQNPETDAKTSSRAEKFRTL